MKGSFHIVLVSLALLSAGPADATTNWAFLKTIFQTNTASTVNDTGATNSSQRLYRARLAP